MWHRDTKWANAVGKTVLKASVCLKTKNHHLWSMIKCNKMKCDFIYWAIIMCPAMFSVLWIQNWVSQARVPFSRRLSSSVCVVSCFKSCPSLCDPMDSSQPGSSVHGILQARILEWVAMPSSRDHPYPEIEPSSLKSPVLANRFFTAELPGKWQGLSTKEIILKLPLYINFKILHIFNWRILLNTGFEKCCGLSTHITLLLHS